MNIELKSFLLDLIYLVQDKYNESFISGEVKEEDRQFKNGLNIAYYDVLDLVESQLKSFGYDVEELQPITPNPGEKIIR